MKLQFQDVVSDRPVTLTEIPDCQRIQIICAGFTYLFT
jgi:hypothetical protein